MSSYVSAIDSDIGSKLSLSSYVSKVVDGKNVYIILTQKLYSSLIKNIYYISRPGYSEADDRRVIVEQSVLEAMNVDTDCYDRAEQDRIVIDVIDLLMIVNSVSIPIDPSILSSSELDIILS